MGTLILNTGKEIECSVAEISPGLKILYLVFPNLTVPDVAPIMCSSMETTYMRFIPETGSEKTFEGYTTLVDIVPEPYGIRVGMRQS